MSDLENFCQMLDHARLPYITQTSKWHRTGRTKELAKLVRESYQ